MKTEIKLSRNLTKSEKAFVNRQRVREFGKRAVRSWKADPPQTKVFFLKDKNKVAAFCMLIPIRINYLKKKYSILGIASFISVEKGKGHGKSLVKEIIKYSRKTGKTALGFTEKTAFFKKAGLGTKKGLIKRFIYKNPKTGKEIIDNKGDGIYFNGRDNFIKKVLSRKDIVYINIMHW
ncbi:hypothetical protein KY311_05220 [Candidatus Woesearchaeota archaeon]|nr:hypothetical protein [Candidatus Woesearchaeota archaeon]